MWGAGCSLLPAATSSIEALGAGAWLPLALHARGHQAALLPARPTPRSVASLRLQEPEAALVPLRKLHTLLPDQPEVVHCIALAHDMMGDTQARGCVRACLPACKQGHGCGALPARSAWSG